MSEDNWEDVRHDAVFALKKHGYEYLPGAIERAFTALTLAEQRLEELKNHNGKHKCGIGLAVDTLEMIAYNEAPPENSGLTSRNLARACLKELGEPEGKT
jgi:hypothetical protein